MPWFVVKQPDGNYARFSTVVDDFTHLNYPREDAVEMWGAAKVERADNNDISSATMRGGDRWEGCLRYMRDLGVPLPPEAFDTPTREEAGDE